MSSWKWAIVHAVILTSFCFGYYLGFVEETVICLQPSKNTYDKLKHQIDSLENLIPDQPDTLYRDGNKLFVFQPQGYIDVLIKYSPEKTFEDYIVPGKFKGKVPPLNFSTCEWGKKFITRTKEAISDTAVFAGYYAFAWWGCGAPCQMCSIVDMRTGNVYSGPDATGGYAYRADSRILIVNPPDSNGYYHANSLWPPPEQYLWTGSAFLRIE